MESIRGAVSSLTGYGAHPKEGDVAAQTAPAVQDIKPINRDPDELSSNQKGFGEPKNLVTLESRSEDNSRPDRGDNVTGDAVRKDPAVIEEKGKTLSGSGVDGSHSAVFGLTPDGHVHDDTAHGHTAH